MKRLANFGVPLSRAELKSLVGGVSGCSASANCTGCRSVSCKGSTTCTAKDDDGATCDGAKTGCKKYGDPGCI